MTFFSIPICKVGQIAFFVKEKYYTQFKKVAPIGVLSVYIGL